MNPDLKTGEYSDTKNGSQKLRHLTEAIASCSKDEAGAYTRLPFSAEYFEAAKELKSQMQSLGMTVSSDSVGNIKGLLPGSRPDLGKIMTGSHLDTVQSGGLFDGALGIAASLLCVKLLQQNNLQLRHSLEIIGFQGEEGSDLGGTFGSRCMMGLIPPPSKDYEKILEHYHLDYQDVLNAKDSTDSKNRYVELHIEQGRVLESRRLPIGVVSGIVGITRYQITVCGEANHAGTTPMIMRHDALTAASRLILHIHTLASERTDHLVATVGKLEVFPGAPTIIPGKVEMVLEIRHMEQNAIDDFINQIMEFAGSIQGISISFSELVKKPSVHCDPGIKSIIADASRSLGLSFTEIPSGAGHDGNAIGQRMPIGMIFVPSKGGISHSKDEWTNWEDAFRGAMVLYRTILQMDKEDNLC